MFWTAAPWGRYQLPAAMQALKRKRDSARGRGWMEIYVDGDGGVGGGGWRVRGVDGDGDSTYLLLIICT